MTHSRSFALVLALVLVACSDPPTSPPEDADVSRDAGPPDAGPAGPVVPVFDPDVLTGGGGFFDFPFPSELRTDIEGRPDLSRFPRARGLVEDVIDLLATEPSGFSPITGVYFRFTGALDEASLRADPAPADGDLVLLVDLDAASPERGRRMPAYVRFQRDPSAFWSPFTLVVRAVPGVHLHPGRRYAAVVLKGVRAADGTLVEPSPELEALARGEGEGALADSYAALFADLASVGIPSSELLVATAFRTSDRAAEMDLGREYIRGVPLPAVTGWAVAAERPAERQLVAQVEVYELIDGEPPYTTFGSARIIFGPDGEPVRITRRTVNIGLSLPTTPAPPGGYPVVLYGHGTGGNHRTHFGDEGAELAAIGVATLGFEAALHGGRMPGGGDLEALIVANPVAAREVVRQTVIDQMLFLRMLEEGAFDLPGDLGGAALARGPVLYMGHSQGAQEAGVLLGVEPTLEAAFLSEGGGGGIITVVERELSGSPIVCTIAAIVSERCEVMGEDHPLLTLLVQPLLDPADPLSFAHRFHRERPQAWAPLSIAMTEGTADEYTPPRTIEALAAAIGLPLLEPVVQIGDSLRLASTATLAPPVSANIELPGGARVTGGLMQWAGGSHFVIYSNDDARRRYVEFFRTALAGTPTLVGPL